MSPARVTIDDLAFAVDWIEQYEADEGDSNGAARDRLVAWLRAEIERRQRAAAVREVVKQTGVDPARARRVLAAVVQTREALADIAANREAGA